MVFSKTILFSTIFFVLLGITGYNFAFADSITFDNSNDNSGDLCNSSSCSIELVVAPGENRMIFVATFDEHKTNLIESIDINGEDKKGILVENKQVGSGSTTQNVELWRILESDILDSSNNITVNFKKFASGAGISVSSFSSVKQQAEEAKSSNSILNNAKITTEITPPTDDSLIVSVVGNGQGKGVYTSHGDGQTEISNFEIKSAAGAVTFEIKEDAGLDEQSNTYFKTANRQAIVSASFAPAGPSIAQDDSAEVNEGEMVTIDVAGNDSDPDSNIDLTSIEISQQPQYGSLIVNVDGTVKYTHDGSETTSDNFQYTIMNTDGEKSNKATVNITIIPVNDSPVANDDSVSVDEGDMKIIDVADNDSDPENNLDLTSIEITKQPEHGTLVVNTDGTVKYTHDGSETLSDYFEYAIFDTDGENSNVAQVSITINPVNDGPPVAENDSADVFDEKMVTIDVADNDSDPDNNLDLDSIEITTQPKYGDLIVNADGTVKYIHDGTVTFSDYFEYTISDGEGLKSNTARVEVEVHDKVIEDIWDFLDIVDDALEIINETPTVDAGLDKTINFSITQSATLTGTASDDGIAIPLVTTWTLESGPESATIVNPSDLETEVSFTELGTYVFRLTVFDGIRTVFDELTITLPNNPPVVSAGADLNVRFINVQSIELVGTATDDGVLEPLVTTWTLESGPESADIESPSSLTTTVNFTELGTYVFSLSAFDGLETVTDEVTVEVSPNETPVVEAGEPTAGAFGYSGPSNNRIYGGHTYGDGKVMNISPVQFRTPTGASVTDPDNNLTSILWEKESGPGDVTFSDETSANSSFTASEPGDYVLKLTASDGVFTVSDTINWTVVEDRERPVITGYTSVASVLDPFFSSGVYNYRLGCSGGVTFMVENEDPSNPVTVGGQTIRAFGCDGSRIVKVSGSAPTSTDPHTFTISQGLAGFFTRDVYYLGDPWYADGHPDYVFQRMNVIFPAPAQTYTYPVPP